MRHIGSPFQITTLLQCSQSCPHARFNIRNRIIPSSIPGNLQSRTTHPHTLFRHVLYRLPDLLNFTNTQFRLIQQNEMLIQIIITVKDITSRIKMWITSGPTSFLYIIFQRIGNIVMHYQSHILLIDSHTESRRSHDNTYLVTHKCILIDNLLVRIHLSIKRQRLISITSQFQSQLLGTPCPRHIYNSRTSRLRHQFSQFSILILIRLCMNNRIAQVGSRSRRSKQL